MGRSTVPSRTPLHHGSPLHHDGLLLALVGALAVAAAWFALGPDDHLTRIRFFWAFQVPLDAALAALSWQVSRAVVGVGRRFWVVLAASASAFTIGDLSQTVIVVVRPAGADVNGAPAQMICFLLGVAALVVVMLMHPAPVRTARQRAAFWLDALTVLAGAVVLAWCFALDRSGRSAEALLASLGMTTILLVSSYAAIKMAWSSTAPLTRVAALPMVAGVVLAVVGALATPAGGGRVENPALMLLRVLPSALLVAGPRIQQLQARHEPGALASATARTHTLVPYASIALVFAALLGILPNGVDVRLWGVAIGAGVVTGLVVARQLVTFRDNADLIRRLDTALGDLRENERRLVHEASHDRLTGLPNRRLFTGILEAMLAEPDAATRRPGCRALLLIDLDDFKTVNDTLGHTAGDAVLVAVAGRLVATVGEGDLVARLGGDEFAILVDVADGRLRPMVHGVLDALSRPVEVDGHDLAVRASIGVVEVEPGTDPDSLIRDADIAMYEAKEQGRSRCVRYDPAMGARVQASAQLGAHLREALDTGQLFVVYQPVVGLDGGRTVGVEALLRWSHPERGLVPPCDFVPAAERNGMIIPIGRWVLDEACRQVARWRRDHPGFATLTVNVNVAGRQLLDPDLVGDVAAALERSGLPPHALTVEVTENAALQDDAVVQALHDLRALGVMAALDDFGTGASSLGLLLTCPVTTLKLDRSFVESVTTVSRQAAVATAVIDMARALDLRAVAEGVETAEQARLLGELGYQHAQGYLFSRPLPAEELSDRLAAEQRARDGRPAGRR